MPELPEVETIKRVLRPHIINHKIVNITVNNEKIIARPQTDTFVERNANQTITDFTRRGKFLKIHLENGCTIVLHLRMTGCLTLMQPDIPCEKHTHLIFHLDNGQELRYEDARRFGKFWLIGNDEEDLISGVHKLGIEPFDEQLSKEYLKEKICRSKKPIKEMLLDQSIIAGIGNIYSDEILFTAKILPDKPCNQLTDDELRTLAKTIPEQLNYFIDKNAVTFEEYIGGKGKDYRNTPYLQVYGKEKELCPICKNAFQGKTIGGRHSVFCTCCQK